MKERIFLPMLAIGVGIGIGIGATNVWRMASEDSSAEPVSMRIAENLGKRQKNGEPGRPDSEQVSQIVESLMQILNEEIGERQILAEQIDELRAEMIDLQRNFRVPVEAGTVVSQQRETQVNQTVEGRLASSGFTQQEIEALNRREAGAAMRQIELDDQARREDWINTPRYFEESNNLTSGADSIRSELGDDAYNRYLFASGRPNALAIGNVIATSPAEQAGLNAGDVVMTYGGERVFSTQQLTNLRSSGDKGSPVIVEIIRDGQAMRISMPRGPMGIQTRGTVIDPNDPGQR